MGILLYTCYGFNVSFLKKNLFIFLGKFGPKIWSSLNLLKFGTEGNCYMLISILIFNFWKFLSFIIFGQIWFHNLKFSKLTKIWYRLHCYMLVTILIFIFSKFLSQNLMFSKLTEIWYKSTLLYADYGFHM